MNKSCVIFSILILISINFVSAYNYSTLDFSDILNSIDPQTMFLVTIFLVSFSLLYFSLSRVFNKNQAIAGVLAFTISLFLVYSANQAGIDFEGTFSDFGIDSEMAFPILSIITLALAIILWVKLGLGIMMILFGFLLVIMSFFAYEKALLSIIGATLILVGAFFAIRKWKKRTKAIAIKLR